MDNLSVGMYNGLVAFGNRVGSASGVVPPLNVDGVNCNGVDVGWTRFMTLGGTPTAPTWTLSSAYLVDPEACTGNFCGETVAVGSNNRVLVGCPEYLMPAGKSFGKALVFDVSNPAYPSLVAKYVAPLGQRGLGNADVGFATFIDMDDQRIAFATDFVATQVRGPLVHFCALANARIPPHRASPASDAAGSRAAPTRAPVPCPW